MPKAVKKAAKKRRQPLIDPNLSAVDMIERSLRAHEAPSPVKTFKDELSAYMSKLGRKGGRISGAKRKANIPEERRREIASLAARKRWDGAAKRKPVAKKI